MTSTNDSEPFISVIMPIRNEGTFIKRSLEAVFAQDYPTDKMEILVVDGRSTDNTRELVSELQSRHPTLKLLDNPGMIVPIGMNIALRESRGEIIVRVDGHCEIAEDYVRRCIEHLQEDGADGVGGPIETIGESYLAQAIAVAMSSPFGVGGAAFRTIEDRKMYVDTVAFPAYTRKAIEKAGLYDEEFVRNQDDEYNYRLRKLGGKILLTPDIRSRYYSRGSLRKLWRQYFQYGYWKVRVMQKHSRQMRPRQFAPPLFVVALLLSAILTAIPATRSMGAIALAAVGGSYLVANLAASFVIAYRNGWSYLPIMPPAFAALHTGYGAGFCLGLLRFSRRWGDHGGNVPKLEARKPSLS